MASNIGIPYNHFSSVEFQLQRFMQRNQLAGGVTQVREAATPRWRASYRTAPLTETQRRGFLLFLERLKGGLNDFMAYDPSMQVPLAYQTGLGIVGFPDAGAGWPVGFGICSTSSIAASGFSTFNHPSLTIVPGDVIGLYWPGGAGQRGLYRIISGGGTGTSLSFLVEPTIPSIFIGNAGVAGVILNPSCNMILEADSVRNNVEAGQLSSISFSGIQKVI